MAVLFEPRRYEIGDSVIAGVGGRRAKHPARVALGCCRGRTEHGETGNQQDGAAHTLRLGTDVVDRTIGCYRDAGAVGVRRLMLRPLTIELV